MVNLLIPYKPLTNHVDPNFNEFTYGDWKARANKLRNYLKPRDYVFFHSTIRGKHYITAYFVVDRVLETSQAASERAIADKYQNPHITEYIKGERREFDDAVLFGDPILSRKLPHPLPFDRLLSEKTSLEIPFSDDFTENQCIGSATRQWRILEKNDVEFLLDEIKNHEQKSLFTDVILSTDEILEIREVDLENFIVEKNSIFSPDLVFVGRQIETAIGRIDLLFEDANKDFVVVELKLGNIGRAAISQIRNYIHEVQIETGQVARGIIVCKDILPTFEEEFNELKGIRIFRYGWKLCVSPLEGL